MRKTIARINGGHWPNTGEGHGERNGINDFVAMQKGFFAAEGLDVTFDWQTFRGTQSS